MNDNDNDGGALLKYEFWNPAKVPLKKEDFLILFHSIQYFRLWLDYAQSTHNL